MCCLERHLALVVAAKNVGRGLCSPLSFQSIPWTVYPFTTLRHKMFFVVLDVMHSEVECLLRFQAWWNVMQGTLQDTKIRVVVLDSQGHMFETEHLPRLPPEVVGQALAVYNTGDRRWDCGDDAFQRLVDAFGEETANDDASMGDMDH